MIALENGHNFLNDSKRYLNRAENSYLKLKMLKLKIERYDNEKELNTTLFSLNDNIPDFLIKWQENEKKKNEVIIEYNKLIERISKSICISLLYLLEIFYLYIEDEIEKDREIRINSKDLFFKLLEFIDRDDLNQKIDLKILIPRIIHFEFYLSQKEIQEDSYESVIASRIQRLKSRVYR